MPASPGPGQGGCCMRPGARGRQRGRSGQNSGSPMSPYRTAGAQRLRRPPHLCFKLSSILWRHLPASPMVPQLHGDSERRHPPQLPHLATHPSLPAVSTDAPAGGTRRRRESGPKSHLGQVELAQAPPGAPHSGIWTLPVSQPRPGIGLILFCYFCIEFRH